MRGPHDYGDANARFGAPRNGHVHQGQDVFAACGTPLVAARGGVVRANTFQADAGNYVVIDGEGTDVDYAYMHLREPALQPAGARVFTGQLIGYVGDTGDAVGCHLHFEMWTGPGWYSGGAPLDPLAFLQAWDEMAKEESAKNPFFKKVLDSQRAYAANVVPAKRFMYPPYSFTALGLESEESAPAGQTNER